MSDATTTGMSLRIGHVRGVTLNKWRRIWQERFAEPLVVEEVPDNSQLTGLREHTLDMCFVRLPIDREGLHLIPLYEELMVAWTSKDHVFAAADDLTLAELEGETVLTEADDTSLGRMLGGAVLMVPMSIARGMSRRDLTYRTITDAEPSPVGLAWRVDDESPLIEEFIGVVRGRTVNSSRSRNTREAAEPEPAKPRAKQSPPRARQHQTPRGRGKRPRPARRGR